MHHENVVKRFHHLSKQFDERHQPGATLDVKDELELGSGQFNDRLTIDEVEELTNELESRLPSAV